MPPAEHVGERKEEPDTDGETERPEDAERPMTRIAGRSGSRLTAAHHAGGIPRRYSQSFWKRFLFILPDRTPRRQLPTFGRLGDPPSQDRGGRGQVRFRCAELASRR